MYYGYRCTDHLPVVAGLFTFLMVLLIAHQLVSKTWWAHTPKQTRRKLVVQAAACLDLSNLGSQEAETT